jgi:hypothetical protein
MKKLFVLVALLALVPALVPAKADALTLRQRVTRLEGKLSCLRRIPVTEFYDYAAYGDPSPSGDNSVNAYATTANTTLDRSAVDNPDGLRDFGAIPGLDWDFNDPAPDYFVLAIRANDHNVPYPGCASKFRLQPTPFWWGRATPAQRMTRARQLARAQ